LQVDFNLPNRLDASYIGEDNNKHVPVMLHRAILGSLERFLGILIENYEGKFPLWLSPVQVAIATITSNSDESANTLLEKLRSNGLRSIIDLRNEKINYKIREHSINKVPYILVLGDREVEENTVTIRRLGSKEQKTLNVNDCIDLIKNEALPPDLLKTN
jgi:threonyl-tRNA synthetase